MRNANNGENTTKQHFTIKKKEQIFYKAVAVIGTLKVPSFTITSHEGSTVKDTERTHTCQNGYKERKNRNIGREPVEVGAFLHSWSKDKAES